MEDQAFINELAFKLFSESHQIWTNHEIEKYWQDEGYEESRNHYKYLAEIALRYFKSIYYSL